METEIQLLERDHRPRNVGRWKSQGKTPLEPSEGTQLSWHPDFGLLRPNLLENLKN